MAKGMSVKLPNFDKLFKDMAAIPNKAAAAALNDSAYEFRSQAIDALSNEYTIRVPYFLRHQMRVGQKAKGNQNIDAMIAQAGSVGAKGFSGWTEPLDGSGPGRDRIFTLLARMGNYKNVVHARNRLQPGANYPGMDGLKDLPEESRVAAAVARALRKNGQQRMILRGVPGWPDGLYAPTGETGMSAKGRPYQKVRAVQIFNRKPKETAHFDWVAAAMSKMGGFVGKAFGKAADYYAKKALKKSVGIK
ncbi:MAG: hypothetical protein LBT39_01975 [Treponema sp.]|jgi:hypothetical protein|nr:hypothetical protein [Treponema sp.]